MASAARSMALAVTSRPASSFIGWHPVGNGISLPTTASMRLTPREDSRPAIPSDLPLVSRDYEGRRLKIPRDAAPVRDRLKQKLGGRDNEIGFGIAADASGSAYGHRLDCVYRLPDCHPSAASPSR
jgi:hypothetical protein